MATPYASTTPTPPWPSAVNQHRSNLTGKRKADDDVDSAANGSISSQFKKLRLNHRANNLNAFHPHQQQHQYQHTAVTSPTSIYRPHIANTDARPAHPIHTSTPTPPSRTSLTPLATSFRRPSLSPTSSSTSTQDHRLDHPPTFPDNSFMSIDDTPHRIIIHDLDAEIAAIEADESARNATVFLPDIDKKVSAIPQRLLQNSGGHESMSTPSAGLGAGAHADTGTALVLYKDPSSISVPEEEDVVRKTIIAARQRAREKAVEDQKDRDRERERFLSEYRARPDGDVDFDDAMTDHSSLGGDDLDAMEIE